VTALLLVGSCASSFAVAQKIHRVIIFSGHTANPECPPDTKGAKSASGVYEFRFNDEMTRMLRATAPPDVECIAIPAELDIPLYSRAGLAEELDADLLIEAHHDSVQPHIAKLLADAAPGDPILRTYSGFSIHVHPNTESVKLAKAIEASVISAGFPLGTYHREGISGERMKLIPGTRATYERRKLRILRTSPIPAVILEFGCIANPQEERLLRQPKHQEKLAQAVWLGVSRYLHQK
jgi:N-acetylmuramoyl-L-alanine amidase